jgi:hypothetical protein
VVVVVVAAAVMFLDVGPKYAQLGEDLHGNEEEEVVVADEVEEEEVEVVAEVEAAAADWTPLVALQP